MAVFLYSQKKRVDISSEKIGSLICSYTMSIDIDKADTLYYVYIGFQNKEYSHITDIKSVMFVDTKELSQFTSDLKKMIPEMDEKKNNFEFKRTDYVLSKYDFTKDLYLKETRRGGYTSISKGQVEKLIEWIEGLQFKGNG